MDHVGAIFRSVQAYFLGHKTTKDRLDFFKKHHSIVNIRNEISKSISKSSKVTLGNILSRVQLASHQALGITTQSLDLKDYLQLSFAMTETQKNHAREELLEMHTNDPEKFNKLLTQHPIELVHLFECMDMEEDMKYVPLLSTLIQNEATSLHLNQHLQYYHPTIRGAILVDLPFKPDFKDSLLKLLHRDPKFYIDANDSPSFLPFVGKCSATPEAASLMASTDSGYCLPEEQVISCFRYALTSSDKEITKRYIDAFKQVVTNSNIKYTDGDMQGNLKELLRKAKVTQKNISQLIDVYEMSKPPSSADVAFCQMIADIAKGPDQEEIDKKLSEKIGNASFDMEQFPINSRTLDFITRMQSVNPDLPLVKAYLAAAEEHTGEFIKAIPSWEAAKPAAELMKKVDPEASTYPNLAVAVALQNVNNLMETLRILEQPNTQKQLGPEFHDYLKGLHRSLTDRPFSHSIITPYLMMLDRLIEKTKAQVPKNSDAELTK